MAAVTTPGVIGHLTPLMPFLMIPVTNGKNEAPRVCDVSCRMQDFSPIHVIAAIKAISLKTPAGGILSVMAMLRQIIAPYMIWARLGSLLNQLF